MNKLIYSALFHKADEGGFWVSFPDFPECLTQGASLWNAYEMARDAVKLAIYRVWKTVNRCLHPPIYTYLLQILSVYM